MGIVSGFARVGRGQGRSKLQESLRTADTMNGIDSGADQPSWTMSITPVTSAERPV